MNMELFFHITLSPPFFSINSPDVTFLPALLYQSDFCADQV